MTILARVQRHGSADITVFSPAVSIQLTPSALQLSRTNPVAP